jgi:hypothetical protein
MKRLEYEKYILDMKIQSLIKYTKEISGSYCK